MTQVDLRDHFYSNLDSHFSPRGSSLRRQDRVSIYLQCDPQNPILWAKLNGRCNPKECGNSDSFLVGLGHMGVGEAIWLILTSCSVWLVGSYGGVALLPWWSLDESGTIISSCKVTQLPTTSSCIAGKDLKAVRHYDVDRTGTVARNTLPFQLSHPISKTCFLICVYCVVNKFYECCSEDLWKDGPRVKLHFATSSNFLQLKACETRQRWESSQVVMPTLKRTKRLGVASCSIICLEEWNPLLFGLYSGLSYPVHITLTTLSNYDGMILMVMLTWFPRSSWSMTTCDRFRDRQQNCSAPGAFELD